MLEKIPSDCRGYYESSQLELPKCSQEDLFVKKFEQRFHTFLRDFNLSYVHHVSFVRRAFKHLRKSSLSPHISKFRRWF